MSPFRIQAFRAENAVYLFPYCPAFQPDRSPACFTQMGPLPGPKPARDEIRRANILTRARRALELQDARDAAALKAASKKAMRARVHVNCYNGLSPS